MMKSPMIHLCKGTSAPVAPLFEGQGGNAPSCPRTPASLSATAAEKNYLANWNLSKVHNDDTRMPERSDANEHWTWHLVTDFTSMMSSMTLLTPKLVKSKVSFKPVVPNQGGISWVQGRNFHIMVKLPIHCKCCTSFSVDILQLVTSLHICKSFSGLSHVFVGF